MCGIAGIISQDRQLILDALERMGRAQRHRGPDDQGQSIIRFGDRWLGLAHQRLSILDRTMCAHQPMENQETGDQLICNGEIYNYRRLRETLIADGEQIRSSGDTEVLLRTLSKWGAEGIRRLQGMFAFAFYDARGRALVLARDSVGIKPLYVAHTRNTIIFASEVRAILASGLVDRKIDLAGLAGLLAYGCLQQPRTMIQGIQSFPPGHYQIILSDGNPEGDTPMRFWTYPEPFAALTEERAVPEIRQAFDDAVRDHLAADVPVGVFLSSGLDSTAIASAAVKHTSRLKSFTVGFSDQLDLSESTGAAETARLLGLDHTDIQISDADALQSVVEWLDSLDQPSVDGLNIFLISKVVRQNGVTVALSGQGGDELFGGYPSFLDVPRLTKMMGRAQIIPQRARMVMARILGFHKPVAFKQKLADIVNSEPGLLDLYLLRRRAASNTQLNEIGLSSWRLGLMPSFQPPEAVHDLSLPHDVVCAVSQLESRFYQHNMLLRDSDTNGMAHSLEIRVPMLDQRMLNLMHSVPGAVRLPQGQADKHLIRRALGESFSDQILNQKKRGFVIPIRRWMLGPLRPLCEEALTRLKSMRGVRAKGIDTIWQTFLQQPESPIWSRAFTLVVVGHWLRNLETIGIGAI